MQVGEGNATGESVPISAFLSSGNLRNVPFSVCNSPNLNADPIRLQMPLKGPGAQPQQLSRKLCVPPTGSGSAALRPGFPRIQRESPVCTAGGLSSTNTLERQCQFVPKREEC